MIVTASIGLGKRKAAAEPPHSKRGIEIGR